MRDDIEAWINSLDVTDLQRKALMQDARATQQTLTMDKAALQQAVESLMTTQPAPADLKQAATKLVPACTQLQSAKAASKYLPSA
ncbi:MAG: hypothetical protein LBU72_05815 [Burkholderiaceae bacterium]|nr:hypothetical protein [Burkholderiaceae bacterium]